MERVDTYNEILTPDNNQNEERKINFREVNRNWREYSEQEE
jgi:hypothetical protein